MFHLVRNSTKLLSKVIPVTGDLSEPGLGLSASDSGVLRRQVQIVLHAAADIELDAPIHKTLRANYLGTQNILEFSSSCPNLHAHVHVSSTYVNANAPESSAVEEVLYTLRNGSIAVNPHALAEELLALPAHEADERARLYLELWKFPYTYCLVGGTWLIGGGGGGEAG